MRWIAPCLVTLLLAGPLHAEEPLARDAEVKAFVASLLKLVHTSPAPAASDVIDAGALVEELDRGGYLQELSAAERTQLVAGIRVALPRRVLSDLLGAPETMDVVRIDQDASPERVVVLVRHTDAGFVWRSRLYLVRRPTGWKLFDTEDLDIGMRSSTIIGIAAASLLKGERWDALKVLEAIQTASGALEEYETATARTLLEEVEPLELPAAIQGVVQMLLARVEVDEGHAEAALERITRLEALLPAAPIADFLRAEAFNDLGRHAEALSAAQRYIGRMDADALVQIEVGRAQIGLEHPSEAIVALLAALDEVPGDVTALSYLAEVLPAERRTELAARLARLADPATEYGLIADYLESIDAFDALEQVTIALAPRLPEHADVPYYEGLVLARRGLPREAAVRLEQALRRLTPEQVEYDSVEYLDAWLDAMFASDQAVEAARRVPEGLRAAAFDRILYHLKEKDDRDGRRALLKIAADFPEMRRRIRYEEADLLHADAQYAEAVAKLEPLRGELAAPDARLDDFEFRLLWDVEDRLVRGLVHLARYDEAMALATAIDERDEDARYLVLVHALRQEPEEAIRYLLLEESREGDPATLFTDPDLAGILATAPYRDVRRRLLGDG